MKKSIIATAILISAGLFNCAAPSSDNKENAVQASPASNDLPNMVINLVDGTVVNVKDLQGRTMLVIFHPDCDHCQREAAEIQQNLASFRNSTIYFITSSHPIPEIVKFANDYKLLGNPNVYFAETATENILKNFGPIATPSVYIYSSEQKLVKAFNGEVKVEMVLKYI